MKRVFLIIVFLLFTFSILFTQNTQGRAKLRGVVTDLEGKPLRGVMVKLFSVRANGFHSQVPKTDGSGKWKALFVRGGRWKIDFEKVGYATAKMNVELAFTGGKYTPFVSGEIQEVIQVKMQKLKGPSLGENIVKEIEQVQVILSEQRIEDALKRFLQIKEKYKEVEGIAFVNLYIGNCYSMLEKYEKAIEYFKAAVEKYPENKDLIISIGNSYNNLKKFDKAMEWFNKISTDDINNEDSLYNIGVIFYNSSKYEEALKYFKKSTEVNPKFAEGFYQLGMTYTAMNKVQEAVETLKKFIEMAPDSPNYQTAKAIIDAFSK